jgi:hypothetical protein
VSEERQAEPLELEPLGPADEEALAWMKKVADDTTKVVGDALGRVVALSAALLAGSVVFLNQSPLPNWCRAALVLLLLAALLRALIGLYPVSFRGDYRCLEDIQEYRRNVIARRSGALLWSSALFLLALSVGAAGLILPWLVQLNPIA